MELCQGQIWPSWPSIKLYGGFINTWVLMVYVQMLTLLKREEIMHSKEVVQKLFNSTVIVIKLLLSQ